MDRFLIALPLLVGLGGGMTLSPEPENPRVQAHRRPAVHTARQLAPAGPLADDQRIEQHCLFGRPRFGFDSGTAATHTGLDAGQVRAAYGPTTLVPHEGYVLQLGLADKIPLWVAEKITASQLRGDARRSNYYRDDPMVPDVYEAADSDYTHSGYDRGHQVPAGNQKASQRLNDQTFHMTNMAPQRPRLNRYVWRELETQVRDWVRPDSPVHTITGPLFHEEAEERPATADGLITHHTIGSGGVSVPTHFYKIVAQRRGGAWRVIAFVLPNQKSFRQPLRLDRYIRSVDWIETRSGLNFFPELGQTRAAGLEGEPSVMW